MNKPNILVPDEAYRDLCQRAAGLEYLRTAASRPIDMVLLCPNCGTQHIDRPDDLFCGPDCECSRSFTEPVCTYKDRRWTNPPHKSHLCRTEDGGCGHVWRPCDSHHTNGVKAVKPGEKDDPVIGGVGPTEVRILLGSRMFIDGSQHYRNGTMVFTVKQKARGT